MIRSFLALVLLALPALAGTQNITLTDSSFYTVNVGAPPPGATALRYRVKEWSTDYLWGRESFMAIPTDEAIVNTIGLLSYADGAEITSDRAQDYRVCSWSPYDGTWDYAGTSGATWTNTVNKGASAWVTLPTTASIQVKRRTVLYWLYGNVQSGATTVGPNDTRATVEWEWLP